MQRLTYGIFPKTRIQIGLGLSFFGLFTFALGAAPQWFGMDRSPVVGFVQIAVFLSGLGFICLGGYVALIALWNGTERTLMADIGSRLVATGFVLAVLTGMADIFGLGSENLPLEPVFGFLQTVGVFLGELIIAAGLVMLIPLKKHSSSTQ